MLIRFDSDDDRGPTAQLWSGIVDWVRGSLATALGQRDFEDFAPFLGFGEVSASDGATSNAGTQITSDAASPAAVLQTDRYGVIEVTEAAGTNECVGVAREIYYDIQNSSVHVIEARLKAIADANTVVSFVGFSDVANPDDVFASGAIAVSGNQDTLGLRWNDDETIDIVAVDDGTLTVLKDNIGVTRLRTDGQAKLGLKVEKINSSTYRLVPSVDGVIARSGIVNVVSTVLPENPMRPVVAQTVASTTAPAFDLDWIYSADK